MTINLAQDWPVYILLGAAVYFFIYVIVKGNQAQKEDKNKRPEGKGSE